MNYKYDIFIIGGGINGAGIDRDAGGRNLKLTTYRKLAKRTLGFEKLSARDQQKLD